MIDLSSKKVVFLDLDDTLIKTASGKIFPRDVADYVMRLDVLKRLRGLSSLKMVFIVANQGGIPKYYSERDFKAKMYAVKSFVQFYLSRPVMFRYCISMDKSDVNRKPNTGMLESLWNDLDSRAAGVLLAKEDAFYIGDASGIVSASREDYSNDDKVCAERFGIDYVDVEEFLSNN